MTVIEELMATVRAQQHTIEVLTVKLEETNAKLDKANARIAANHRLQTAMKSLRPKASGKRAAEKQAVRLGTRDII